MSYTIFALKWRPKDFDEIIGQQHVVSTLKNAIQKNRLAHAFLFAGPRGVGKTSTARILAKSLNCKEGTTLKPCQKCPSCKEISQGINFDVIEIDGASNRGIDEIRALRESVKFAPAAGKYKIYIIDEVHMLTTEAFNALLKTLEEPPEFVKFIFATTQANKVIPTILSRCQRFDFRRIPLMEIVKQLERIVSSEKLSVDKDVLLAIARSSDGALRDAESILDQLASFSREKISLNDVISVLGVVEEEVLFSITEKIILKDANALLELLSKVIEDGKDMAVFLNNLIEHFRNLMVAKITSADSELIDLPQDICEKLLEQSKNFTLEEIFSAFNALIKTQEMAKRLDSWRLPLEVTLVKLAHEKKESPGTPSQGAKKRPIEGYPQKKPLAKEEKAKKEDIDIMPASTQKEEKTQEEDLRNESLDIVKNIWNEIIESIAKIKMSVATYLNEGIPVKLEKNILTVAFPKSYSLHKESLEKKENRAIIEDAILKILHNNLRVNFVLSQEINKAAQEEEDSFLKSALDAFKGRIIHKD